MGIFGRRSTTREAVSTSFTSSCGRSRPATWFFPSQISYAGICDRGAVSCHALAGTSGCIGCGRSSAETIEPLLAFVRRDTANFGLPKSRPSALQGSGRTDPELLGGGRQRMAAPRPSRDRLRLNSLFVDRGACTKRLRLIWYAARVASLDYSFFVRRQ